MPNDSAIFIKIALFFFLRFSVFVVDKEKWLCYYYKALTKNNLLRGNRSLRTKQRKEKDEEEQSFIFVK